MLSAVLFSFDSFSEYPQNFDWGYSEKRSKSDSGLCGFSQINRKIPGLFTESSHSDEKCNNARAPPRKSEFRSSHTRTFGGIVLYCRRKGKISQNNFSKPEATFQVIPVRLEIGSNSERWWERERIRPSPEIAGWFVFQQARYLWQFGPQIERDNKNNLQRHWTAHVLLSHRGCTGQVWRR